MALKQHEQDGMWNHIQTQNTNAFDLSYPRLRFLAKRCAPETRVLNIGVGSGYLEELLLRRGVDVHALDPSAASIERLRGKLPSGDRAKQGYGQAIPFDSGYFDTVIMTEVLEHLPDDVLHPTLDEVRRVLKPGGLFTGTVPYREDLDANEVICPRCHFQFHRWGHEQRFDGPSMHGLLEQHGFRVEQLYPRAFADFMRADLRGLLKASFRHLLGRLGEPLVCPNLFFAVRRSSGGR